MIFELENEFLKIAVDTHGAELSSIYNKKTGKELLWQGDSNFWGRKSPVLFPVVGKCKNLKTTYMGKEYCLGQHGFARDSEFTLIEKDNSYLSFELTSDEQTLEKYPFRFSLICSFRLSGNSIVVGWTVKNTDNKDIYFSIGAHPAFYCEKGKSKLIMKNGNNIKYHLLNSDGLYTKPEYPITPSFVLEEKLFDNDALVIENSGVNEISIDGELTVKFDAPLFGIWSPAKKNAPFVCIEPWFGRCDAEDFCGDITEREWGNKCLTGEKWHKEYEIIINEQ